MGSDMNTLQSRKIVPNLNQDSLVRINPPKKGDSGQNSKATLKIRIKIEKNHNPKMHSSRSSSLNNREKRSLTGTLTSKDLGATPE